MVYHAVPSRPMRSTSIVQELGAHSGTKEQANQIVSYVMPAVFRDPAATSALFLSIKKPAAAIGYRHFISWPSPQRCRFGILPAER